MLEELLRPLGFITFHKDVFLTPSLPQSFTQTDKGAGVIKLMSLFKHTPSLSARGPLLSCDPSVFVPWCPVHSAGEVQFRTLTVTKTMSV